jgi:hypothetical protein
MPFELVHFRESQKILKENKMLRNVQSTLKYLDDVLYRSPNQSKLMKEALSEKGWRESGTLSVLEGRGYQFKGLKNGIALEGNFSSYEFILEGLFRLQVAFDKRIIQTGILLLTGSRSEKTKFGSTRDLCEGEVEQLYPTISMPVSIAIFDLGAITRKDKREDLTELREKYAGKGEGGEPGESSESEPGSAWEGKEGSSESESIAQ